MTEENSRYTGRYSIPNSVSVEIKLEGERLVAVLPGMPPGFEIKLLPQGPHTFLMAGGPLDGGLVVFRLDPAGNSTGASVGPYELERDTAPSTEQEGGMQYLRIDPFELDEQKVTAFEGVYQAALQKEPGGVIDYELPYPKHEFIRYLEGQHKVIFHGSNKTDIEEFKPVRQSIELYDPTGRGNVQAVYGTHKGLWAMWFAILNRQNSGFSTSNGVLTVPDPTSGGTTDLYFFSVSARAFAGKPWTDGTLYILPGEMFRQLQGPSGELLPEWVCETAVKPLARLPVSPQDFPFLSGVGTHDDSESTRFSEQVREIFGQAERWSESESGFELQFAGNSGLSGALVELIEQFRKIFPSIGLELAFAPSRGPIYLRLQVENVVLRDMLRKRMKEEVKRAED